MGTGGSVGTGGGGTGGTTGGAGGGSAGTGGGKSDGGAPDPAQSVLQRGKNNARTAHFVQPNLTTANAAKMALDTDFKATFTGHLMGVPLYLANGPNGKGAFYAATLENNVYAFDETTGAVVWQHSIGTPGSGSSGPGITARGIISTPVIDATARVIYVVGGIGPNLVRHEIHALSVDTGMEVAGGRWPIDVSKITAGSVTFNPPDQHQRSALSLVSGILYVAFGGNYGDGGNYHGWVIAVDTADPTKVAGWATFGTQEGIWAPGGMASDGNGVFAITGNGRGPDTHMNTDAEEIIRITGMAVPHRDTANMYYPMIWKTGMDNGDKDFGSCSPLVLDVPGSTPSKIVVAPAKPGHVYFLDAANLGGLGGELRDLTVASTTAESVYTAPTAYTTAQGLHLAISTTIGSVCPNGVANSNVMGIAIQPGSPPTPRIAWCAKVGDDDEVRRRSPISTTTDGQANAIVWFMNGSKLNAFDGSTGSVLFNGGTGDCGGVHRHTSPIAANGRIVVGGDNHLCSWSVH
jgi:outer membrane protein assembly factor BamB